MDKDKKRNILIIGLLAIALLMIAFIVWWQFFRTESTDVNINTSTNTNTNTQQVLINVSNINSGLTEPTEVNEDTDLSARRLAGIFAERFGSYNTETEFQNTVDLKIYMTDSMKQWADNFINTQKSSQATNVYYSVITKVLSTKILSESETDTTIELLTQRTENGDNFEADNTFNQSIELELNYINDVWLVNKVTWGDKS